VTVTRLERIGRFIQTLHPKLKRFIKHMIGWKSENKAFANLTSFDIELITKIRSRKITYLSDARLASIINTVREVEAANLPGIFIEAGCALGGSAIVIAKTKGNSRPFKVYDVFGMIPPPTKEDNLDVHERYRVIADGKSSGIGGDKYYGYESDLYGIVQSNLKDFGINGDESAVYLIKGLLQDTMTVNQPVSFAHIDVDWYEPVITCLQRIVPNLVLGGSIILDDYHDWGGCRKAVDEYISDIANELEFDDSARSLKLTRIKSVT